MMVTPMMAGMICSMMSLVSMLVGYGMYDIFYKKKNKEEWGRKMRKMVRRLLELVVKYLIRKLKHMRQGNC